MPENIRNNGSPTLSFDEGMCERYLLGELSESDQEIFERAYFGNDVFFDRFMAFKNELLDLYSRGELDPRKQEQIRIHFSATDPRRKQLAESQQFIQAVTKLSSKADHERAKALVVRESGPFFKFLKIPQIAWAGAAVVLLMGVGIWVLFLQPRGSDVATLQPTPAPATTREAVITETAPTQSTAERQEGVDIETAVPQKPEAGNQANKEVQPPYKTTKPPTAVKTSGLQARLVLGLIATRDINDANTLRIYSDTSNISIELTPPTGSYKRYTASIGDIGGGVHWQTRKARPTVSKKLKLVLDPKMLRRSDYVLTLRGVLPGGEAETIAEYYFHVVHDEQKTPSAVVPK